MPDIESLLARLAAHKVAFVIVGGYAAAAHGCSLVTLDLDICCSFAPANLMRLQQALRGLHPVHRMTPGRIPFLLSRDRCRGLKNLYLSTDAGQLDCLGRIAGIGDYAAVRKASRPLRMGSKRFRLLSLEATIDAKSAMGRPRDLEAVRQLKAIREAVARRARRRRNR